MVGSEAVLGVGWLRVCWFGCGGRRIGGCWLGGGRRGGGQLGGRWLEGGRLGGCRL